MLCRAGKSFSKKEIKKKTDISYRLVALMVEKSNQVLQDLNKLAIF